MSDLIDRQALLKQIGIDSDGEPGYYGDTWKFIDTIKNLPSATDNNVGAEHGTNLAEVGADAVSRKAVKELAYSQIRSMYCGVALKEQRETMLRIADNVIGLLAPVTSAQPATNCSEFPNNSDTISRQAAIDALCNDYCGGHQDCKYYPNCENLRSVQKLPSAELGTNLASLGTDCISRQRAINATWQDTGYTDPFNVMTAIRDRIKQLPPIQPEIIYCKDCKHFIREDVEEYTPYGYDTHFHAFCDKHWDEEQGEYIDVNLDDYCSFAERREVTT